MKRLGFLIVCVSVMLVMGQVSAVAALGDMLFANGGNVTVQVEPASAGYTSELWLFSPASIFVATNRDVGTVVDLGPFAAGNELLFGIYVRDTGNTFYMGPGSRNGDGQIHANVEWLGGGQARVGFEDLWGGGDRDYNDNMFLYMSGVAPTPVVPEPASCLLGTIGLMSALGGLRLRTRK